MNGSTNVQRNQIVLQQIERLWQRVLQRQTSGTLNTSNGFHTAICDLVACGLLGFVDAPVMQRLVESQELLEWVASSATSSTKLWTPSTATVSSLDCDPRLEAQLFVLFKLAVGREMLLEFLSQHQREISALMDDPMDEPKSSDVEVMALISDWIFDLLLPLLINNVEDPKDTVTSDNLDTTFKNSVLFRVHQIVKQILVELIAHSGLQRHKGFLFQRVVDRLFSVLGDPSVLPTLQLGSVWSLCGLLEELFKMNVNSLAMVPKIHQLCEHVVQQVAVTATVTATTSETKSGRVGALSNNFCKQLVRGVCVKLLALVVNKLSTGELDCLFIKSLDTCLLLLEQAHQVAFDKDKTKIHKYLGLLSELLFLLCQIVPQRTVCQHQQQPTTKPEPVNSVFPTSLQQVLVVCLTQPHVLVRKQALYLLSVSYFSVIGDSVNNHDKDEQAKRHLENWQSFLTASEVIHQHQEQHLIEQVWPQVQQLLESSLFDNKSNKLNGNHDNQWPYCQVSFQWIQTLLVRVLAHENPIIRRDFLTHFMRTCLQLMHDDVVVADGRGLDSGFQEFVLTKFLITINDSFLFKTISKRREFMDVTSQFLARFLVLSSSSSSSSLLSSSSSSSSFISQYLMAVQEAMFGESANGRHCPEALLSMLQVFENVHLQQLFTTTTSATSNQVAPSVDGFVDLEALTKVRFFMDVHVNLSFPTKTKAQVYQSLVALMTGGFCPLQQALVHGNNILAVWKVLMTLPLEVLLQHYATFHNWLHQESGRGRGCRRQSIAFDQLVDEQTRRYFAIPLAHAPEPKATTEAASDPTACFATMSASQLARLLLFCSEPVVSPQAFELHLTSSLLPLVQSTPSSPSESDRKARSIRLVDLLAKLEGIFQTIRDDNPTWKVKLLLNDQNMYGLHKPDDSTSSSSSSSSLLCHGVEWFDQSLGLCSWWLESTIDASCSSETCGSHTTVVASCEISMEETICNALMVATRVAMLLNEKLGDLERYLQVNGFCRRLVQQILLVADLPVASSSGNCVHAVDRLLALRLLSQVACQHEAIDAMDCFDAEELIANALLELELQPCSNSSTSSTSNIKSLLLWHHPTPPTFSSLLMQFVYYKWRLLHHLLVASTMINARQLHALFDQAMQSLEQTGTSPQVLYEMVRVLSLVLKHLLHGFRDAHNQDKLEDYFATMWTAYSDCKSKPDALTKAMIDCMFQPHFVLEPSLNQGQNALLKRWFARWLDFGRNHRPNVVFHVTCRLCQVIRMFPQVTSWYLEEILLLLLYKEPFMDEKEQIVYLDTCAPIQARFARLVMLSTLEEMPMVGPIKQEQDDDDDNQETFQQRLVIKLLKINLTSDWKKAHMIHSEGFGQKLRCWQALCVLHAHVTAATIDHVNELFWKVFQIPDLPPIRFYMELFAMKLCLGFPNATISRFVVPLLENFNLMPQVATSVLIVAGVVLKRLSVQLPKPALVTLRVALVKSILPWLNCSHGHTRVLVQFLLSYLLPAQLHELFGAQVDESEVDKSLACNDPGYPLASHLLAETARFFSENKECKRMFRRQAKQFEEFQPEHQCTLAAILAHTTCDVNEFADLLPKGFTCALKDAMNELYARFQLECFEQDLPRKSALLAEKNPWGPSTGVAPATAGDGCNGNATASATMVQRKIDLSGFDVDATAAPRADGPVLPNTRALGSDHEVVLCASLVDKLPNLAGLARTCEIFHVTRLQVADLRVVREAMFEQISVTANKWIAMEQVKVDEMVQSLQRLQCQGFTLVGLEQTSESCCLSQFQFPSRIVLVLGREKEGIPVEILQLLDVCVEIPQFGIIRSLNVHVSGALMIWEYTKQRMLAATAATTAPTTTTPATAALASASSSCC